MALALMGAGACAGPTTTTPEPAPQTAVGAEVSAATEANQQGALVAAEAEPGAAGATDGHAALAPMRDVVLWCEDPTGAACRQVSEAIKAPPVATSAVPSELLTLEDLPDDCTAPGMEAIERRAGGALSLSEGSWRDQVGDTVDRDMLSDMYMGSGCIHDSDSGRPVVKIHATRAAPRRFLVRVWEHGQE